MFPEASVVRALMITAAATGRHSRESFHQQL
jgi:hypothetical protein